MDLECNAVSNGMNVMKCLMTSHTGIEAKARADSLPAKAMLSHSDRDPNC